LVTGRGGDGRARSIAGGSRTLAAALVGAVAFAATLLIQRDFVLNSYLHADDAIFIPRALAGQATIPRDHPLIYLALEALGPIALISTFKLLSTGFLGLAAALMALWLFRMGAGVLSAGLAALALVIHPVAIDQGLFVTGSHPIIGTVLVLGSLLLIMDGWSRSPMVATATAGAAGAFALLAALASPCYFLAPFAPLVWLAVAAASEWRGWRRLVVLSAVLSTPIILHVLRDGMQYHYTAKTGFTDFSPENVATNLAHAVWLVLRPVFAPPLALAATYALGLAGVSACLGLAVWNTSRQGAPADAIRPSRRLILGSAAMLVTAALAFGPSAIVTSYAPRYATAPFVLGALAVLAPLLWAVSRWPLSAGLTSVSFVIVLVAAGIRSAQLRDGAFGPELAAHRAAMRVIATEAASWEPNAQIVLVLPADSRSPTGGFNHWSTWYVRAVSSRADVLALFGREADLDASPFIKAYRDHGEMFWRVVNGRSQRIPMRGLEAGRPLYYYRLSPRDPDSDPPRPLPVLFFGRHAQLVAPGVPPRRAPDISDAAAGSVDAGSGAIWPVDGDAEDAAPARRRSGDHRGLSAPEETLGGPARQCGPAAFPRHPRGIDGGHLLRKCAAGPPRMGSSARFERPGRATGRPS
jgi:hypothetical protein